MRKSSHHTRTRHCCGPADNPSRSRRTRLSRTPRCTGQNVQELLPTSTVSESKARLTGNAQAIGLWAAAGACRENGETLNLIEEPLWTRAYSPSPRAQPARGMVADLLSPDVGAALPSALLASRFASGAHGHRSVPPSPSWLVDPCYDRFQLRSAESLRFTP